MELLGRIVVGMIGIAAGALITIKHEWIMDNFGRLASIERIFGSFGGSRLFYIFLGILISIFSLLYITGVFPGIITTFFAGIFGR